MPVAAEAAPGGGRRAIAQGLNGALLCGLGAGQLYLLLGPPLLGLPEWTALLPVLLTTTHWALAHEAIHGLLFADSRANAVGGRLLAVLLGAPFALLRAGHLLHHRFSRTADVSEAWQPPESRWRAVFRHYGILLGGLYGAEVASGFAMLLPAAARQRLFLACLPANALGQQFRDWLRRPAVVRESRIDGLAVAVLFVAAGLAWGDGWPWLLAALAGRGLFISFFDNAYHYGTAVGDSRLARNHALPGWASAAILHFNFHGTHHRHAAVPWHRLPAHAQAEGSGFDGAYWGQALRQLRGPLPLGSLPRAGEPAVR